MTWEDVDDARAARYRAVHAIRNTVEDMAVAVEADRDASVASFTYQLNKKLLALIDAEVQYTQLKNEEVQLDEG